MRQPIPGDKCHYCGAKATTRDHIIPKALGGKNGLYNLVPACLPCNARKDNNLPTCSCDKCESAVAAHAKRLAVLFERVTGEQASWAR